MGRILALDLATTTGWATDSERSGVPDFGSLKLDGDDHGSKGAALADFLAREIAHRRPELIAFEQPSDPQFYQDKHDDEGKPVRRTNFMTVRMLLGVAFLVDTIAKQNKIDCVEVPVQSWRAFFTGTTRGGKDPAQARCRQLGWLTVGFDESDACGLWAFAKANSDPKWSFDVGSTPLFGGR